LSEQLVSRKVQPTNRGLELESLFRSTSSNIDNLGSLVNFKSLMGIVPWLDVGNHIDKSDG